MNILVTGANGLLATNIINVLLTRGYQVTGLLRDSRKFLLPPHPNLTLVLGDITDFDTLNKATAGCDGIIHCAATTDQSLLSYDAYHRINVEGTANVVRAGIQNAVQKIVYVGTANTFGYGSLETPGDETLPPSPPFDRAWYAKSKLAGQVELLAARDQIPVTVVSPTFMIGPYDGKPSSGAIIRMGYGRKLIFHPPGGKNFVNAEDAAAGVVDALEKGKNGACYLLAGENLTYKQFFRKLSAIAKQSPILVQVPPPVLLAAGYIGNLLRYFGVRTPLSSLNMKILCIRNFYSNQKAKNELGTTFHPIEQGIQKALDWFLERGMIRR